MYIFSIHFFFFVSFFKGLFLCFQAIFGRACSFSSQARALEIKSTLQFLSGEKIGKSDLELIKKSYENSISDFTAANGVSYFLSA